ncbi:NAD(P)/FAD-dependent oxidoreductase [Fodinicola acaciae]|uniref:NAD(P)/FAD-dependent oxidoreductase n=1 Tax=Fodinicola acaciae TaxID=2681555 RepID=UPI0013D4CC2E|nr:FAD-dependent oxidoreductase [Fodinicola acaciae]
MIRDAATTIIGAGAVGCAVAYHLARDGWRDVQVVDARDVAEATTAQAAGLVGQVRSTVERTRLAMASVRLFSRLEAETGYPPDWRQTGSIRIALTDERVAEFRRMATIAESAGLETAFLTPEELRDRFPLIDTGTVRAALWCPTDGYLQPHSLTTAYSRAARDLGVTFHPRVTVTGLSVRAGAIDGLRTDAGDVHTELVVDAAGPWAAAIAAMAGAELPIVPVRHEYFVSTPVAGWSAGLPVLRIPDLRLYVRAEGSAVLCGGWEAAAVSRDPRSIVRADAMPVDPDWDVLARFASDLASVVASADGVRPSAVFRGWPAFAPDGRFVVGPVPGIRGFVMAAACNAHGVSGSAGLAEHVLESMGPDPSPYVRSLSPARFMAQPVDWEQAQTRARSVYENYYAVTP